MEELNHYAKTTDSLKVCSWCSEPFVKHQSLNADALLTSTHRHENQCVVSEMSCNFFYGKLIAAILPMESQWLRTPKVLEEQQACQAHLEARRNKRLHQLRQRKRRIMDFVEAAYQQLEFFTKNVYLDVKGDDVASAVAGITAFGSSESENCVCELDKAAGNCKMLYKQNILRERLAFFSAELDTLSIHLCTEIKAGAIDALRPETLRIVLNQLKKMPLPLSVLSTPSDSAYQREWHLPCSTSSATTQLRGSCRTFALYNDKRVLAAEFWCGMSEVCLEDTIQYSEWLPPVYDADNDYYKEAIYDDSVVSVVLLSDGRAAVGLAFKQVVVLLRKENFSWNEYRRFDPLDFIPYILSSHGDVLAAGSPSGRKIQLISIRCGRHLGPAMISEYQVKTLAVCSTAVITGSCNEVELGDGGLAYVIDAISLANHDKRLWRHTLSGDGRLNALCAHSLDGCLYAAFWVSDRCSGHVAAFSLESGKLLRVVLSLDDAPQSPLVLLAMSLWIDAEADEQRPLQQQNSATFCLPLLLAVLYSDVERSLRETTSAVTMHRISRSTMTSKRNMA